MGVVGTFLLFLFVVFFVFMASAMNGYLLRIAAALEVMAVNYMIEGGETNSDSNSSIAPSGEARSNVTGRSD